LGRVRFILSEGLDRESGGEGQIAQGLSVRRYRPTWEAEKGEERFSSQRTLGEEAVLASLGMTMAGTATLKRRTLREQKAELAGGVNTAA